VTGLDPIRQFAEEPNYAMPEPWLPGRRFIRPTFTLNLGPDPTIASVSRVRAAQGDLDATVAEVRTILRDYSYTACAWHVGPSCRPTGMVEALKARGFTPGRTPTYEPHYTAMMLTREPPIPSPAPGVETRLVRDFDEYVGAFRAMLVATGEPEGIIASWVESAPSAWAHESGLAKMSHIAFVDGAIAGGGMVAYGPPAVLLGGSAVLPQYRGRGVYRALVASRWRAAVEIGKPALTIHAGEMSRPILERCGFEEVCRLDVLLDPSVG
jgi:GNAT superfamily N-acetyltransferase